MTASIILAEQLARLDDLCDRGPASTDWGINVSGSSDSDWSATVAVTRHLAGLDRSWAWHSTGGADPVETLSAAVAAALSAIESGGMSVPTPSGRSVAHSRPQTILEVVR